MTDENHDLPIHPTREMARVWLDRWIVSNPAERLGATPSFVEVDGIRVEENGHPTLAGFLLARIAERRAAAPQERQDYYGRPCPRCGEPAEGLSSPLDEEAVRVTHDPYFGLGCPITRDEWQQLMPVIGPTPEGARVLAECDADQRIVERCEPYDNIMVRRQTRSLAGDVLRLLALPYADHPDYREEWKL